MGMCFPVPCKIRFKGCASAAGPWTWRIVAVVIGELVKFNRLVSIILGKGGKSV